MMSFHPQGMQHPGMAPGQPGMVPQPGHPLHPGGQMHPGMHPMQGGPHMNQSAPMMSGMHPGAVANPQAMSHMQPPAQMFQNPGMGPGYQQGPPMMVSQQNMRQRHAMMAAQANAPNGQMPMGMTLAGNMNPAAFQAMQQGQIRQPNLPQHLQPQAMQSNTEPHQRQQQIISMQQQRMAFNAAQAQQQQQQIPPHTQSSGPVQAPQMRPQPSMQSMHDGSQGGSTPQQPPPPQIPSQPSSQQGQSTPQNNTRAQSQQAASTPQQANAQPPQSQALSQAPSQPAQQATAQQNQQQPGRQAGVANKQAGPSQQEKMAAFQENQNKAMAKRYQRASQMAQMRNQQGNTEGNGIAKVLLFCEKLTSFDPDKQLDVEDWQDFVSEWFTTESSFVNHLWNAASESGRTWEIPQPILGRYFWVHARSGFSKMQISVSEAHQRESPAGCLIDSPSLTVTYCFDNGSRLVSTGSLRAHLGPTRQFEWLEFNFERNEEFMPSQVVINRLPSGSPQQSKSPKMTKTPSKQKKSEVKTVAIPEHEIPRVPTGHYGTSTWVFRFLELSEVMIHMRDLFEHSQQNTDVGPTEALDHCLEVLGAINASITPQHAQMAGQVRTPGLADQSFFASPQNMPIGLPNNTMNSPHMRAGQSSAMQVGGGMMAPAAQPMVAQLSQQGSNSATASSNASPNVPGKKRRASTIKAEGEDVNGTSKSNPKATPKLGGKRQKNNAT